LASFSTMSAAHSKLSESEGMKLKLKHNLNGLGNASHAFKDCNHWEPSVPINMPHSAYFPLFLTVLNFMTLVTPQHSTTRFVRK
jgi:hypothetical protein